MIRQCGLVSIQRILFELVHSEAQGEKQLKDDLEKLIAQMYSSGILYSEARREFSKRFIMHVLTANCGNQSKAARELGFHRNTMSRAITELQIDMSQFKLIPRRRRHAGPPTRRPVQPAAMAAAAGAKQA
jgi:Fis family transcriptional regulator